MSDGDDLIAALTPVAEALRRLGVRHYVGGSVASTFHGAIRSTMDVDLVCDLGPADVEAFVESFGEEFYVSPAAVRDAVQRKSCFNLIHMPTSYKVDVFVSRGRPFDLMAMERATPQPLGMGAATMIPVATAEDSIVARAGFCRGLLVQGQGCLPVLQWPPNGAGSCASRRPRHSPGARAAVGDLRAEAIALLPR